MSVNFLDIPSEGTPLCRYVKHAHLSLTEVIVLYSVSVENDIEIS